jgi:putative ABC transport system permease protein
MPTVILNETAAHKLGFSDPRAAVGKQMIWTRDIPPKNPVDGPTWLTAPSLIIAVVPDLPITVRTAVDPTFYTVQPRQLNVLSIKMTGQEIPGTIQAIADTWKRTNGDQPLQETFLSRVRMNLYLDLVIQGVTVGIGAVLAVVIACLGLFALSAYTTERRTKEIGVRKVMGADTGEVVLLLLWQFTVPILWAIAIALPISWLAMGHWLQGFVYHVDLSAWTFVLAAVAAVGIALLTVAYQSFVVARAKPASALRYE